ncbi:MAG TPA: hypothetical protein VHS56_01505 [Candidatus Cybelea sp.]|jgi:hypothetical protein|nr:hypothetical protein [Candidatus Cybelea sp.]
MNTTGLVKCAVAVVALPICSACGGGSAVAPSASALDAGHIGRAVSVNGRLVTAAHPNMGVLPRYATILPERHSQSRTHEYIINDYGTYASIFDYPKSDQQIGTITNVGGQGCTNVLHGYGKKIFWIVAGNNQITEYLVPKKPLKTLSESVGQPSSCAMDANGDLAVGLLSNGDIDIFKHASGTGTVITTPLREEYFDGYDNHGNLFFDGFNNNGVFELVELPKGRNTLQGITTSNKVEFPGSVQWDGTHLAVTDQATEQIYQYTVSGTQATLKGTVSLSGSSDCAQTWIATRVVFCGDAGNGNGEVFNYPAGGSPVAVFSGNFDLPLGVVAAKR